MIEWSGLLLDVVKSGLGAAASAAPDAWKKRALARLNDANPFAATATNHDLLRAVRLAWIEAALAVVGAAAQDAEGETKVAQVVELARNELRDARSLAFNRDVDPAFSPIDAHLNLIMNGVSEPIASSATDSGAQEITRDFAATFCEVIKWPLKELPPAFARIAASGLATKDGAPRDFGGLAFAEFAEILKSPTKYPEAGKAFQIATEKLARDLAEQTFAAVHGLDAKMDAALAQLDSLETLHAGIEGYLGLLPGIADDVRATRESVEQNSETLAEVKQTLSELKALSEQQCEQLLTQFFEMSKQNGDLNARHGALLNLVTGFVASITRENVPEDQIAATLFRMAAEWRTAGDRLDALGHSRALTPRLAELRLLASEAHARGDVAAASAILAKIDEEERAAEQNLQNQEAKIQAEIAARRAGRLTTKDAQIALALSGLRPREAARFIVEKLDLEAQDPARRFAAMRDVRNKFYVRGRDKGVNLDLEVAIELARSAVERASDADQRGQAQNDLGNALVLLGGRESSPLRLEEAIAAFNAALKELTRARVPLKWATTQNNLCAALTTLGGRERNSVRLEEAVDACHAALKERTRESCPLDWAGTQNNLGAALQALGESESDPARLEEAVDAYRAVLDEYTRERAPLEWAMAHNNLGNALQALGKRESSPARLLEAVVAYRATLEEYTRGHFPLKWAMTQNNLGTALAALGERQSSITLWVEAVVAYRAALEERTRERVPLEWAATQNNLGNALRALGANQNDLALLAEAIIAFLAALQEHTRARFPLDWAGTQINLGAALVTLGLRESDPAMLVKAVAAYRAALEELTRDRLPLEWAATQNNLGIALRALGECLGDPEQSMEAVAAYRAALEEFTRERVPYRWAQTRENMAIVFFSLLLRTGIHLHRAEALAAVDDALAVYRTGEASCDVSATEALRAAILATISS